ncbi:MAG: hypothetical protein IT348_19865 [Candidatus Eisenbacteria bacterium]|nr:hypothetical protein [Candidatus Eisenbacteria bacterium]
MTGVPDPRYVLARRVLLDALEALGEQREGVVLIGAQAVYARTGEGDLQVTPFTEDADLAVDPRLLGNAPLLEACMLNAGFLRGENPGDWRGMRDTHLDLMVPDALSQPGGRRGARIPPHAAFATRRVHGLEGCVVDRSIETIGAMDPADPRAYPIRVAGPAALLVAKLYKLGERTATTADRVQAKDALDVYRLLRAVQLPVLVQGFEQMFAEPISRAAAEQALRYLGQLFATPASEGPQLVAFTLADTDQPELGRDSSHRLAQSLLERLRRPE